MFTIKDNKKINDLMDAILLLKNSGEAKKFFRDLLTEQEILEFARRWQAVTMLDKKQSYMIIEKDTGLSSATLHVTTCFLNCSPNESRLCIAARPA